MDVRATALRREVKVFISALLLVCLRQSLSTPVARLPSSRAYGFISRIEPKYSGEKLRTMRAISECDSRKANR